MLARLDILDDRLEAIDAADDRGRPRAYLRMWRDGRIDPLRDGGVVLIVEAGDGSRPVAANDGPGDEVDLAPDARRPARTRGPTRH